MLIVEYSSISIGAASADLFTNIGGTRSLSIQSIWSYVPDQDLRLVFNEALDDADDLTLIVGDLQLEFPPGSSGNGSFKWTDLDLDWQDGETIAVSIVPTSTLTETTVPNTAAAGQPTIIGTPQVGQVLTADTSLITDADGLLSVSYLYQWLADDVNISGATRQSYTLSRKRPGQDHQGNRLVQRRPHQPGDAHQRQPLTRSQRVPTPQPADHHQYRASCRTSNNSPRTPPASPTPTA